MNETEKRIAAFLRDYLILDEGSLDIEELIFTNGIVDSFSLIEIIQFVEESEGVEVLQDEVTLENFDSIKRIAAFVSGKKDGV